MFFNQSLESLLSRSRSRKLQSDKVIREQIKSSGNTYDSLYDAQVWLTSEMETKKKFITCEHRQMRFAMYRASTSCGVGPHQ